MHYTALLLAFFLPALTLATPLAWDGAPAYSGASNNVDGGSVSGDGGIQLIKLLSHNGNYAGTTETGDAQGGDGGNRVVGNPAVLGGLKHRSSTSTASGSGGGAAYSGASGSAVGGNSETDPSLVLLSMLSDNAGGGGLSQSGGALGGTAGNII